MHNAKALDLRHRQFLKVLNQYNTEVGKLGAQNHSSYKRLKNHTHTHTHAHMPAITRYNYSLGSAVFAVNSDLLLSALHVILAA